MKILLILNYWEVNLQESLKFNFVNPFIRTKVRTPIKVDKIKINSTLNFLFSNEILHLYKTLCL